MARKNTTRGFKPETIAKVYKIAKEYEKQLSTMDINNIKMCISSGNRKIGRVMNVSIMPGMTCGNCKECIHYCYDIKACIQYANTVISARMRNTMLLRMDRKEYFSRIEKAISRRRTNKYFRWHVAGEIVDLDYFANMVRIAAEHPDFIFWTYTKMYHIVNEWIAANGGTRDALPSNLHVMFSEWKGLPMDNPYDMPQFMCRFPEDPIPADWKCPGNCDVCKAAGRGCMAGETSYADLH